MHLFSGTAPTPHLLPRRFNGCKKTWGLSSEKPRPFCWFSAMRHGCTRQRPIDRRTRFWAKTWDKLEGKVTGWVWSHDFFLLCFSPICLFWLFCLLIFHPTIPKALELFVATGQLPTMQLRSAAEPLLSNKSLGAGVNGPSALTPVDVQMITGWWCHFSDFPKSDRIIQWGKTNIFGFFFDSSNYPIA